MEIDNVGNYNTYSSFRSRINQSYYNITGANSTSSQAGFHKYKLGNPDAKWETTTTYNIGIDFSILEDRLSFNFDLYDRKTIDMLYPESKPATSGDLLLPSVNVGEMSNKGVDVMVLYRGKIGNDFTFNLKGNLSHYKNEIVKLNQNENEIRYGAVKREQVFTASKAGYPISSFYGYIVEGIFNTWEEVEAWPKYNPDAEGTDNYSKPGMFKYKDISKDGKIDADDRTFFGSPHPDLTYGLSFDLRYKNWDFSMFTYGTVGNELLNYRYWSHFAGTSEKRLLYESWTEERYQNGEKITVPIITRDGADELHQPSSYFAEDGSFFRIKNIQLGYTLNSKIIPQLKTGSIYLYVQATNILTITNYSGLDPEITPENNLTLGLDDTVYPVQSNIMFGVNMKF